MLGEDDDQLHGGAGDDTIGSAGGNDRPFGDDGDDTLFCGEGQGLLLGGRGTDTARCEGEQAEYVIEGHGPIVTVRSLLDATDADTRVNIEKIQFTDGEIALDLGWPRRPRRSCLRACMWRSSSGCRTMRATHWLGRMDEGATLRELAGEFANVSKFFELRDMAAADFVDAMYQNILGIEGDAAGRAWWTA